MQFKPEVIVGFKIFISSAESLKKHSFLKKFITWDWEHDFPKTATKIPDSFFFFFKTLSAALK